MATQNDSLIPDVQRLPKAPFRTVRGNWRESTIHAILVEDLDGTPTAVPFVVQDPADGFQALMFLQDEPAIVMGEGSIPVGFTEARDAAGAPLATPAFVPSPEMVLRTEGGACDTIATAVYGILTAPPVAVGRGSQVAGTTATNAVPVTGYPTYFPVFNPFPVDNDLLSARNTGSTVADYTSFAIDIHTQSASDFGESVFTTMNLGTGAPTRTFREVVLLESVYTAAVRTGISVGGTVYPNTFAAGGTTFRVVGLYGTIPLPVA